MPNGSKLCENSHAAAFYKIGEKVMARKIFRETKMQGGNIYRPCKGKENIIAIIKRKAESRKNEHK